MTEARIQHFYDEATGTLSYVVSDENSGHAAVIDPVVGFSMVSGRVDTGPSDIIIEYVHKQKLASSGYSRRMPMPITSQARSTSSRISVVL